MQSPGFWQEDGVLARVLSPVGGMVARATARRVARTGWCAPVPVLCCGNVGVGGAGKTTLALDLGRRLLARGARVAFLTRGYGGRARSLTRVAPGHTAAEVGDEALLLAAVAPAFVGADRAEAARAAVAEGATVLVMDDGLQNPGLQKTLSLLVVDGGAGFGNGRVLPAGPLRETVAGAAARCRAAVLIGPDEHGALAALPPSLAVLRARLEPCSRSLVGMRALAFAGIARPGKFFATVAQAGAILVQTHEFPDHHPFRPAEFERLQQRAAALGATLVTTAKDAARLPPAWREAVTVVDVKLHWRDEAGLTALLAELG